MWKLAGTKVLIVGPKDGVTEFEQIFSSYAELKRKEKELMGQGMTTIVTPITPQEVEKLSERLMEKFVDLHKGSVLN